MDDSLNEFGLIEIKSHYTPEIQEYVDGYLEKLAEGTLESDGDELSIFDPVSVKKEIELLRNQPYNLMPYNGNSMSIDGYKNKNSSVNNNDFFVDLNNENGQKYILDKEPTENNQPEITIIPPKTNTTNEPKIPDSGCTVNSSDITNISNTPTNSRSFDTTIIIREHEDETATSYILPLPPYNPPTENPVSGIMPINGRDIHRIPNDNDPIPGDNYGQFSDSLFNGNENMEISDANTNQVNTQRGDLRVGVMERNEYVPHGLAPFLNDNDAARRSRITAILFPPRNIFATQPLNDDDDVPELLEDNIPFTSPGLYNSNIGNQFNFNDWKSINFDLKKDTFYDLFNYIKIYPGYEFSFHTKYDNKIAFGKGATKQVYQKLITEMVNDILVKTHPYFMDINVENNFWDDDDNIENFVVFVALLINAGCVLPYHFNPILLEKIANKEMVEKELEFFIERIDPELVKNIKKLENFDDLETDYTNAKDFYKDKLCMNFNHKKFVVYGKISNAFCMFDSFNDYDILTIDKKFSGEYTITAEMVIPLMVISDNYKKQWDEFIRSLMEIEIKQMLLLFSNTLSLNYKYYISIGETQKTDLHISTCARSVTINKKLFDNLNLLKIYFTDGDTISDSIQPINNTINEIRSANTLDIQSTIRHISTPHNEPSRNPMPREFTRATMDLPLPDGSNDNNNEEQHQTTSAYDYTSLYPGERNWQNRHNQQPAQRENSQQTRQNLWGPDIWRHIHDIETYSNPLVTLPYGITQVAFQSIYPPIRTSHQPGTGASAPGIPFSIPLMTSESDRITEILIRSMHDPSITISHQPGTSAIALGVLNHLVQHMQRQRESLIQLNPTDQEILSRPSETNITFVNAMQRYQAHERHRIGNDRISSTLENIYNELAGNFIDAVYAQYLDHWESELTYRRIRQSNAANQLVPKKKRPPIQINRTHKKKKSRNNIKRSNQIITYEPRNNVKNHKKSYR